MKPRIFITGLGTINGAGMTVKETYQAVQAGRTGIDTLEGPEFNACPYKLGGQVKTYRPRELVADRKLLKLLGRHDVFGLNAATQALDDSDVLSYRATLKDKEAFNDRFGVYVGSPGNKYFQQYDFMPLLSEAKGDMNVFAEKLFDKVHPMWLLKILPNNVLAYTGIQHELKGPNQNVTNHVAGGLQALSEARDALYCGEADRAVVVSYDLAFEIQQLNYFGKLGILSETNLSPFDEGHDGTLLGEGAAALVIETEKSVKARGATPYAEIIESTSKSDARGIFSIEDDGAVLTETVRQTLLKANVTSHEVGMITAHGNGNQRSDITEAIAYKDTLPNTPVTGFKWSTGHLLCASGILDTLLTCKALQDKTIPGLKTLKNKAATCRGLFIQSEDQALQSPHALVVSRGFGGINTALLLKAVDA